MNVEQRQKFMVRKLNTVINIKKEKQDQLKELQKQLKLMQDNSSKEYMVHS
jgi:hypothetical protein